MIKKAILAISLMTIIIAIPSLIFIVSLGAPFTFATVVYVSIISFLPSFLLTAHYLSTNHLNKLQKE